MSPRAVPYIEWERAILRTIHARDVCPAVDVDGRAHTPYRPAYLSVVVVIGSHADHDTGRNAHPSHARVGLIAGVSRYTVERAVRWAVSHGWLAVQGDGTTAPGQARSYALTLPPIRSRVSA